MTRRMTAEEMQQAATTILSKPTVANKYDSAADKLAQHVIDSIESDDQRRERFERCRLTHGDRIADLTERCNRLRRELRRYVSRDVVAEIERGDA